ncbi:hypothetical protein FSP39_018432 [Pinctada imbricata]|uniref:FAD-binding PCMH-type domain-containing protein n=1 Tax=Pinctada imbricata TaxID=66713 RepID=A0AA89BML0_PINIB|nr:hypothetical protein FSP39_018432 [Pinctada imbricata]
MGWLTRALVTACILVIVHGVVPRHCHVDEPCFPSNNELYQFSRTLDGGVLFPSDQLYSKIIVLHNVVYTKFPIAVAVALTTEDVQKSVLFARKHNLLVSVMSSGHDYNARSTAHESLMIYLGSMNKTKVTLSSTRNPAGEMTCESGNTWLKVYSELTQYGRVIIGGSAHTVAMGGYTLGGGHSPMSRMFGMAVDNLLEVEMVTANGSIIRADEQGTTWVNDDGTTRRTTDADIFWALRGGGGGTFGIVTKFTYKLHYAAKGLVTFICIYPILLANKTNIGYDVLGHIGNLIPGLPKEWGGYMGVAYNHDTTADTYGTISLFLNHYGTWDSPSRSYVDQFANYKPELQTYCQMKNVSTFIDYEVTARDPPIYSTALLNVLMQNDSFTKDWVKFMIDKVLYDHPIQESSISWTGTLLGGKMQDVGIHDTSVHPGWRSSYMSLSGGVGWNPGNGISWDKAVDEAKALGDEQIKFGYGMYPNESGPNVTNWHDNFWGSNYKRLLEIKRKWDPDRFFYCSQCVGSDDDQPAHVPTHGHIGIGLGGLGPLG